MSKDREVVFHWQCDGFQLGKEAAGVRCESRATVGEDLQPEGWQWFMDPLDTERYSQRRSASARLVLCPGCSQRLEAALAGLLRNWDEPVPTDWEVPHD